MSYGNSESDANQPSQELAYPIKSGGVPLLPDLNTHTGGEKRKKKKIKLADSPAAKTG